MAGTMWAVNYLTPFFRKVQSQALAQGYYNLAPDQVPYLLTFSSGKVISSFDRSDLLSMSIYIIVVIRPCFYYFTEDGLMGLFICI